jgi:ferredoxin
MEFAITVLPKHRTFFCQPGETILNAAIRANINISYGCRQGLCGSCEGSLIKGQTYYPSEPMAAKGLKNNQILFCRAIPLTNISIEPNQSRRDTDCEIKTVSARIKTIEQFTSMGLQISVNDEIEIKSSDGLIVLGNSDKYWIVIQEVTRAGNVTTIKFEAHSNIKKTRFKPNDLIKLQGPYRSFG